jgi:hypothetical protein
MEDKLHVCTFWSVIEWCEKYGKHVMLDKPIVTSREGLESLEEIAARGDCRIFVTGTEGSAELRLSGDPSSAANEELYFQITHGEPFVRVMPEAVPVSITQDFVNRIEGRASLLTHRDVIEASRATLLADENANIVDGTKKK